MRIWHVKFFGSRVIFWNNAPQFFSFFFKQGLTSAGRNSPRLKNSLPPFAIHILKALDVLFHMEPPNI